jgi:hypothetical protein
MPTSGFRLKLRDTLFHRIDEKLSGKAVNPGSICFLFRDFLLHEQILTIMEGGGFCPGTPAHDRALKAFFHY